MDKIFVDKHGEAEEYSPDQERPRHIRFPVCLAVRYDGLEPQVCLDFILNISKGGAFIKTDYPFPKGSKIMIHIYIPPESKLLGVFEGEVVKINENPSYVKGMHVRIINSTSEDLERLEEYLEEKRHLLDIET